MSSSDAAFEQKIKELQERIDSSSKRVSKEERKEKCMPIVLGIGIVAPILIWLALYFLKPGFVRKKEEGAGGKEVRDGKLVFWWSVLLTLLVWGALYLYTYFDGYGGSSICSKGA